MRGDTLEQADARVAKFLEHRDIQCLIPYGKIEYRVNAAWSDVGYV